jgi:hypothetical protein
MHIACKKVRMFSMFRECIVLHASNKKVRMFSMFRECIVLHASNKKLGCLACLENVLFYMPQS